MPFNWKYPECGFVHYYSGSQTTRATTNCPQTKKKIKIWQHKMVVEEPKNLHPPKVEKTVGVDVDVNKPRKSCSTTIDSKTFRGIDFNRIANLSTFQRFIIEAIKITIPGFKGVPSRGKKEFMAKEFNSRVNDYRDVINELNEVLKKRNVRVNRTDF